ncbi:sulfatase [Paenibacillus sp. HB172176]|uniref:sulfatase family protein n=1 Tax=Paenibacillus sp. HB172176 TaxID=2493690 RepID=UPI00143A5150|nr:sulfatase [Paenibacillus sp. HB172176]
MTKKPNVIFVFSDQHRAEATGYAGNPDVRTPNLDALAERSLNLTTAVANVPCCCPYRATLMTGQYPLTHGVFVNDVHLGREATSIADAFAAGGYDTAYIGKWHLNGRGRSRFISKEDRQGFDFWQALECTHHYNDSYYYEDEPAMLKWEGYDAEAQTRSAQRYIRGREGRDKPFFLVLSWGPPHNPYHTAPQPYKDMYDPKQLTLRPNVPDSHAEIARQDLAGYYAHISALDAYVGDLLATLREQNLEDDTIFVYTSDHGDMIESQGQARKQRPWEESIRVPFLIRYPRQFGNRGKEISAPFNSPDVMPTLLGLSRLPVPESVEGVDYAPYLRGERGRPAEAALIACIHPSGEFSRAEGGREYRGIRTEHYTYVIDREGPWLLYDNERDPYQLHNLCRQASHRPLQEELDAMLRRMLTQHGDAFLEGERYIEQWGYELDHTGTVPYEA